MGLAYVGNLARDGFPYRRLSYCYLIFSSHFYPLTKSQRYNGAVLGFVYVIVIYHTLYRETCLLAQY